MVLARAWSDGFDSSANSEKENTRYTDNQQTQTPHVGHGGESSSWLWMVLNSNTTCFIILTFSFVAPDNHSDQGSENNQVKGLYFTNEPHLCIVLKNIPAWARQHLVSRFYLRALGMIIFLDTAWDDVQHYIDGWGLGWRHHEGSEDRRGTRGMRGRTVGLTLSLPTAGLTHYRPNEWKERWQRVRQSEVWRHW